MENIISDTKLFLKAYCNLTDDDIINLPSLDRNGVLTLITGRMNDAQNKAVKILRNTKKTALLIYAAAFILLIVAGVRVSGITKEAVRGNDRHKPYEFYELYNDFSNHDYARLQEKVHTNIALGANPGSDEKQLYDFALSYEAAVNYYMYTKTE